MNHGMSFRASRRLSELGDRVAEEAEEYLPEEDHGTAATVAEDLVHDDDLLRDVVEAETLLDRQANARRKETADVWGDDLLERLRTSRDETADVVEDRVEELAEETIEAVEELPDDGGDGEAGEVAA